MEEEDMRFGFGKNWAKFVEKHFNDEILNKSKTDLLNFLKLDDLKGKSFLDIGCGSGLSSLAAHKAGADQIYSFDYDPHSVATTRKLKKWVGDPEGWQVSQGSILDDDYCATLEQADIVYSWGVLHHTGDVWHALENTKNLLKPDGLMFIALYEYDVASPSAEFWLDVKQRYNRSSWFGKRKFELWYVWRFDMGGKVSNLPLLIKKIRTRRERGMVFYNDLVDWLGGWPMEFVKLADMQKWSGDNNLEIINLTYGKNANTEYLLRYKVP